MAFCPKCFAAMEATEVVCPSCGYDFPEESIPKLEGFAYSTFADVALVVSMVAAGLGCIVAVYLAVMFLVFGAWSQSFTAAIAFFLQLGMLIVYMRVSDLKK